MLLSVLHLLSEVRLRLKNWLLLLRLMLRDQHAQLRSYHGHVFLQSLHGGSLLTHLLLQGIHT